MPAPKEQPEKIDFHYRKGNDYRTIKADGIWAIITPRGELQMGFFLDTSPIPELVTHEVTGDGAIGKETSRIEHRGIVRELSVNVLMDLETAERYLLLMQEKIRLLREQGAAEPEQKGH